MATGRGSACGRDRSPPLPHRAPGKALENQWRSALCAVTVLPIQWTAWLCNMGHGARVTAVATHGASDQTEWL